MRIQISFSILCLLNVVSEIFLSVLRPLCERCLNTEIFWSIFSRIRTEYGDLRSKSPYLVRKRENTDQKKLCIWTLFTQ